MASPVEHASFLPPVLTFLAAAVIGVPVFRLIGQSAVLGYLVAGVLFYGMVGWLLDQWLGTRFLVAAGVLLGGGLGTYMMIVRLRRQTAAQDARDQRTSNTHTSKTQTSSTQTSNEESG